MKRDLQSRLREMRSRGEVKTGSQLKNDLERKSRVDLFPGEGREEKTSFGPCYLRELKFSLDYEHGNSTLAGALRASGSALVLPAKDSCIQNFNLKESIFLDIETTGLSGGTGTWAFLIGLGWIEEDEFILRQYFLRRPAEERALLSHFAELTGRFPALVTFNGKMFDLPLIQTRQILAGFRSTAPSIHLDLLHCARALWKKRLPSRTLRTLEEELLGLQRYDDIPGAEIPAVYFDYLRRGRTEIIKKVFQHNVLDILSMVTLLDKISRLAAGEAVDHPAEAYALGKLYLESGNRETGLDFLREAAECTLNPLAGEAAMELALYYKREGKWEEAVRIWEKWSEEDPFNPLACVELAKYFEHRCRNYPAALDVTRKALARTGSLIDIPVSNPVSIPSLQHRLKRLEKRLARENNQAVDISD